MTVDALLPTLAAPSDRPALRFGADALTHAELAAAAAALAGRLSGVRWVGVFATPTLATAVGIAAALVAGVPAVPINPRMGERELDHVVADAGLDLVLAGRDAELPSPLAALPRIDVDPSTLRERHSRAMPSRESAVRATAGQAATAGPGAGTAAAAPAEPGPDVPALVVYTSGTTGPPKGVVLSRAAIAANLDALAEAWEWTADDLVVHALPLFHVHGLVLGVLGPLRRGGALHHLGSLDAAGLAAAVAGGATMVFGVPTQYHRLVGELEGDPAASAAVGRARLLVSGSAPLTAVDHARLERATGLAVRERYGLTETLILTAARAGDDPEPGTVGRPLAGTQVRLVPLPAEPEHPDQVGTDDPDDGLGAVQARGPALFTEYLNQPERTAGAFTEDGWFATGDIGRWTSSGALALVGRSATDLIKSGGYKIGAGEIENALLEHPGVAEAAVVGAPDDDLGERVVAYVVAAGPVPGERELADHVASLLAPHKRPREVRFVDALPRNDMGKIVKARLPT